MDYGLSGQSTGVINNVNPSVNVNNFNIDGWFIYFVIFVALVFFFLIVKKIILFLALNSKYNDHAIYSLRVPKEKPNEKEQQQSNMLQHLREEIGRAETIFKAIGGLRIESWYKNYSWIFGRNDQFSFEIVANHKFISFYVLFVFFFYKSTTISK